MNDEIITQEMMECVFAEWVRRFLRGDREFSMELHNIDPEEYGKNAAQYFFELLSELS